MVDLLDIKNRSSHIEKAETIACFSDPRTLY